MGGVILIIIIIVIIFAFRGDEDKQLPKEENKFPQGGDRGTTPGFGLEEDSGVLAGEGPEGVTEELVSYRKITEAPVAGFVTFGETADDTLRLRFVEKETGHIYEYNPEKNTAPVRISNTTIPGAQEALWSAEGDGIIYRYLDSPEDTIKTFVAVLKENSLATSTEETRYKLDGVFLADDIDAVTVNQTPSATNPIFYIIQDENGALGYRTDFRGSKITKTFSSQFGEWLPLWTETQIYLLAKPSGLAGGYLYNLELSKILGGKKGFTALPNQTGEKIFFTESQNQIPSAKIWTPKISSSLDLGLRTFSDKCVWSKIEKLILYCAVPLGFPAGVFPDDWYKGSAHFSDVFTKINTETGGIEIIFNPEQGAAEAIDGEHLSLSSDDNFLFFRNRTDESLWQISLHNP